jgi:septum formation protein
MMEIVLASSSPRRKEILSRYNVNVKIVKSNIEEKIDKSEEPEIAAMSLAFQKALDVSSRLDDDNIVLAADTIVYCDKILGKPKDDEEAFEMLKMLSGKEHYVITGICIINTGSNKKVIDYVKTRVKFRELTKEKIKKYISTGEHKDKAGAYGIQGYGAVLVESIEGSYSNVVGLPISKVDFLLEEYFNIKLL